MFLRGDVNFECEQLGAEWHTVLAEELGLADVVRGFDNSLTELLGPAFADQGFIEEMFVPGEIDSSAWLGKVVIAASHSQFVPPVESAGGVFISQTVGYDSRVYSVVGQEVYVNYALDAGANGKHVYRRLSIPLRVDLTTSSLSQATPLPVTELSPPSTEDLLDSKIKCLMLLESEGIQVPARLHYFEERQADALISSVIGLLDVLDVAFADKEQADTLVLKPSRGSCGEGIVIINKSEFLRVTSAYKSLLTTDMRDEELRNTLFAKMTDDFSEAFGGLGTAGGLIIEELVKPRPIEGYDSSHSWNIRVLMAGDETIGMYARVGNSSRPVNLYYAPEGQQHGNGQSGSFGPAVAVALEHIGGLTVDESKRVDGLISKIKTIFPDGLRSADIMINEQGMPVLLELNGFDSGGAMVLDQLYVSKPSFASRVVEALIKQAKAGRVYRNEINDTQKKQFLADYLFTRWHTGLDMLLGPTAEARENTVRALGNAKEMTIKLIDILEAHDIDQNILPMLREMRDTFLDKIVALGLYHQAISDQ